MRYLDDIFGARVQTVASNPLNIARETAEADLVIGSVLIPGAKAPKLVTEGMVKNMKPGSVIVDVAIDQGGSVETIDRTTSHADPIYMKHDVVHYAVPNIPGAVPRTSTFALTNATLPYALQLAGKGWKDACKKDPALAMGINTARSKILGLMISNGIVALSSALFTQYQGAADVNMGRGAIVIGLAAVIISEVAFSAIFHNFGFKLLGVALGAVIYYMVIQVVLWLKLNPLMLKLFSAMVVALFLAIPYWKEKLAARVSRKGGSKHA